MGCVPVRPSECCIGGFGILSALFSFVMYLESIVARHADAVNAKTVKQSQIAAKSREMCCRWSHSVRPYVSSGFRLFVCLTQDPIGAF